MKYPQITASVLALAIGGTLLVQGYQSATAAELASDITSEQRQVTHQVASLLDRSHYLDKRMDTKTGQQIFDDYINSLDPNRSLFLQSDVDEFKRKYSENFANYLKRGDLAPTFDIYKRFTQRSNAYYEFADKFLQKPVSLKRNDTVVMNREKLPRFKTVAEQQDFWQKQLTSQLIGMTINQAEDKAKDQFLQANSDKYNAQELVKNEQRTPNVVLASRLKRQQAQMARITSDQIMETVLNSAMATYDPHSNYFAPVQATEMQIQSSLELVGIGVSIQPDRRNSDYTRIVSLVDGGPASRSGQIKANDLIIGVASDGKTMVDTVGWSTREIVNLIRGQKGSTVVIRVKAPNAPDSAGRNVTLVRDVIQQEESGVTHRVISVKDNNGVDKKIGVLEIPSFYLNYKARRAGESYRSVSIDTENALKALNAQNVDGLVVDLRDDPGGSLDEVAKMIGLFVKSGPLVQIRDNRGNIQVYEDQDQGEQLFSKPMTVLVNLGSASASEIFAAAIQDYGRGIIVGSTTTGKGSAQRQIDSLALGSATLTQSKFYRITGGSTQNKGVIPDVPLVNIYDGLDYGERTMKNPLQWDTIRSAPYKPAGNYSPATLKTLNDLSKQRQATNPYFNYITALNTIRKEEDDKKPVNLNIDKVRAYRLAIENKTLQAENTKRQALGEAPYSDWTAYQTAQDAEMEVRSRMKQAERPKLPESEAFIIESAKIMLDAMPLSNASQ
ncbi:MULTISPECIES: carboxy terminal-processing peptidase [unclassified Moraxella]|uniref:carboxy terminal-processing peptidase n=1 Tax=unclassified Moraxella TaxID=2685852 RepID=UPI003AF5E6DB